MKGLFSLAGLLTALAIGYGIYGLQLNQGSVEKKKTAGQVHSAAIGADLASLGKAQRYYHAANGRYGTLEDLRNSGIMNSLPESRSGYVYIAEIAATDHFRIVAKPEDSPGQAGLPVFSIDETMELSLR